MNLRYLIIWVIAALCSACGGGGGGGGSGGGGTGGGGDNISAGDFSLSQDSITLSAKMNDPEPPAVNIRGTLKNAKSEVYLVVDTNQSPLVKTATVVLDSDSTGTLTIWPESPRMLKPGSNTGTITVRACKNEACTSQYSGSPKTITVNYTVVAPEFSISSDKIIFTTREGIHTPDPQSITMSSSENVSYSGYAQVQSTKEWLLVEPSWGDTQGVAKFSILKNLPVGTYTTNIDLIAHGQQLKKTVTVTFKVEASTVDPANNAGVAVSESTANQFDFTVEQVVADKLHKRLYMRDGMAKRVYQVDAVTGLTTRYFEFEAAVRCLAVSPAGDTLYVLLASSDTVKAKALVLDLNSQKVVSSFAIDGWPQGAVVTSAGQLVVLEYGAVAVYDTASGAKRGSANADSSYSITLHPSEKWVFIASNWSPSDIIKYELKDGGIVSLGDSPYHGDYLIDSRVWALSNPDYVLSGGGEVFLSSTMTFVKDLFSDAVVLDVANTANKILVYRAPGILLSFNPSTMNQEAEIATNLMFPGYLVTIDSDAYVVHSDNGTYKLRKFAF